MLLSIKTSVIEKKVVSLLKRSQAMNLSKDMKSRYLDKIHLFHYGEKRILFF